MINALLVKNTFSNLKPFYTGFGKIIFIDIKPEKIFCRQFPLKKRPLIPLFWIVLMFTVFYWIAYKLLLLTCQSLACSDSQFPLHCTKIIFSPCKEVYSWIHVYIESFLVYGLTLRNSKGLTVNGLEFFSSNVDLAFAAVLVSFNFCKSGGLMKMM